MNRGAETREAILDHALRLASEVGLEGLTIGQLAGALELSKSGLFAHFGSKDELQVQVLNHAARRFTEIVVRPALAAPRGVARLQAIFERWVRWPREAPLPGGCIFVQAASELDDRPGAPRDRLVALQREWLATLARVVRGAQELGELRGDLDAEQLAFELYGIMLSCNHAMRLLRDRHAVERARRAFDRLVEAGRRPPA